MEKVKHSQYLANKKPIAQKLLEELCRKYEYVSILVTDDREKSYFVSKQGIQIDGREGYGDRGMVVKVYDGRGYCEYSTNELTMEAVPHMVEEIEENLVPLTERLPHGTQEAVYRVRSDEACRLKEATAYQLHPQELGDEKVLEKLKAVREKGLALDQRLLDVQVHFDYQEYHKLFLSRNRDMEQSVMLATASVGMTARQGEEIRMSYKGLSNLGGAELLDTMEPVLEETCRNVIDLLSAEPMIPGTYECICTPETTGMIVHEAFGHGVEMDMFVKDRALAQSYVGKQVASPLITMHDGNAVNEVATYFFDDEGVLSHDTVIIKDGILQTGISDAQSAMFLGTEPTGNGRREAFDHKTYTRMTNTYFEPGRDKVEDMIASVKYGMLLEEPSSGMEDPKNWGIQCMVNFAREIKDGKLTGRIFSPVVLTGYVPDLLKSISMVSDDRELFGCGACGKGYKEWVRVSDGGPYIKANIRLG